MSEHAKQRFTTKKQEVVETSKIVFARNSDDALFWNARQNFDQEAMDELKKSIQEDGLLEPLVLRKLDNGQFQVVCGECRLRCIKALLEEKAKCYDLTQGKYVSAKNLYNKIECNVLHDCSDKQASRLSIAENIKRKNLTEWELMEYCRQLCSKKGKDGSTIYNRKDICEIINRSASWVSQTMKLYELPIKVQTMLSKGTLPRTVALALLKIKKPHVAEVLDLAVNISAQDIEQNKELVEQEVEELESTLQDVELELAGAELAEDNAEKARQKKIRAMMDRKLAEAKNRKKTADSRGSRLTSDAIVRATDQVTGARRGKCNGMTHKAVRLLVKKLSKDLMSNNGELVNRRDIRLMKVILQMVIGEEIERDPNKVLAKFYESENDEGEAGSLVA